MDSDSSLHTTLLLLVTPLFLFSYAISGFIRLLFRQSISPLRNLPGPPNPSFFMGNLIQMHDQENNNLVADWEAQYGSTFVYRGFIGGCRLMTTDPIAAAHILGNAYDYPKPDFVRDSLATMAAGHDGLLTVEGEAHKRQRKILTPAFSATHIKSLTPIFWSTATQLRDIWLSTPPPVPSSIPPTPTAPAAAASDDPDPMCTLNPAAAPTAFNATANASGFVRVDALSWLGRATLDVIGLAGFGYAFNSLSSADSSPSQEDELAAAFSTIFSTARKFRVMTILQVWFPFLRRFRRNTATMNQAQATMRRIGLDLIEERREAVLAEVNAAGVSDDKGTNVIDGDKTILGRDLLSVLIRSNHANANTPSQGMSQEEILCQISTFIAAGHETTASALTWCLYALVQNPLAQRKLRAALRDLTSDAESDEDQQKELTSRIERCEYLDWVVRESLRVHAPVTNTMRVCMRDEDEIPVSANGYVDKAGVRRWGIRVKKWDIISVPIQAINKSTGLWGEDAQVFRPERWAKTPETAKAIPGLHANTLTFLNGNPLHGNRACIGYKFALIEIKIFLYVLLKDIEFLMDPAMVVEKKVNVVTRPFVKSEPHLGNQMPLYIRRAPPS